MARAGEPEATDFLEKVLQVLNPIPLNTGQELKEVIAAQNNKMIYIRNRALIEVSERNQNKLLNAIRVFGIKEEPGEDIKKLVCSWFRDVLSKTIVPEDMLFCHRRGHYNAEKPRSVVIKFKKCDIVEKVLVKYSEIVKEAKIRPLYHICPELSQERKKLRNIAIEKYGRNRVRLDGRKIKILFPGAAPKVFSCMDEYTFFMQLQEEAGK